MKAQAIRRDPKPAQLAADRRRRAVAEERVSAHLAGMLDGLDEETRIQTCRLGVRVLALELAGTSEGRATGVLSGALARVSPAHRPTKRTAEAEALFAKGEDA